MKLVNRRRKRPQYLLEVKVQTQGRMRHRLRVGLAALLAVSLLGLTVYGLVRGVRFVADKLVYQNPRFAITRIVVDNGGVLTPPQIIRFAGVQVGQNLLSVDLVQVQRNLEMIPLVQRVEVRRVLPSRLFIQVNERVPVARLHVPARELTDSLFLIDGAGVVMKPLKLRDGTVLQPQMPRPVPVLTGVTLGDVRVGRPVESAQVYRALALLNQLPQSVAGAGLEVDQVDVSNPHQLVLVTRQHLTVRFDVADFPRQLRRLGVILAWARQRQKTAQLVDLTVGRSVPVVMN
jgi:cell division protein FtsQ